MENEIRCFYESVFGEVGDGVKEDGNVDVVKVVVCLEEVEEVEGGFFDEDRVVLRNIF